MRVITTTGFFVTGKTKVVISTILQLVIANQELQQIVYYNKIICLVSTTTILYLVFVRLRLA
jgi:hypothetical protein